MSDKGLALRINELSQLNHKKTNQLKTGKRV